MPIAAMTTKDFVYLGLIALVALVFYCHGFFSGVNRSRRIYEALLGGAEEEPAAEEWPRTLDRQSGMQPPFPVRRGSEIKGDFGEN